MGKSVVGVGARAALVMACLSGGVSANDLGVQGGVSPIRAKGRFAIVVENDLFSFGVGDGTDRFYSNGLYLHSEWSSPPADRLTRWLVPFPFVTAKNRSYAGIGLSHELHTPQTLNPCGARYDDPLATSLNPRAVPVELCAEAERDWADHYASRDRPFSAVGSVFGTLQSYFYNPESDRDTFTQGRLWLRADFGAYGSGAVLGYEVQKHWHGFFNEALVKPGSDLSSNPIGWKLTGDGETVPLVQASGGLDVSLYRYVSSEIRRLGIEVDARSRLLVGVPRNLLGLGAILRAGVLPEHASSPVTPPGEFQTFQSYLELSADSAVIATDLTQGAFEDYHHVGDEYALGVVLKPWGVSIAAHLHWQRILFKEPLKLYPSTRAIMDHFHRYGRVGVEMSY